MEYAHHGDLHGLLRKCFTEMQKQRIASSSASSQYYNVDRQEQLRLLSSVGSSMGAESPIGNAPPPHIGIPVGEGE